MPAAARFGFVRRAIERSVRRRATAYSGGVVIDVLRILLGLALLTAGAESLVRGGASLARHLGLTPLLIGLTVVAFGTSAPEMVVSVGGAWTGRGDIALGNVVGSNIFNVGVILGVAALVSPIRIKLTLLKLDVPLLIAVSIGAALLAGLPEIPRWAGVLLLLLLVAYTAFGVRLARLETAAAAEFEGGVPAATRGIGVDLLLVAAGLALLVTGSHVFVGAAEEIARGFGVSDAVIGLTIVAAGTSMPELATSIVAAARRQPDVAVGNVIGSNIFNVLGTLGLAATVRPIRAPGIGALDLFVMLGFAVALLPLMWTRTRITRGEGALLLAGCFAYVWALLP